MNIKQQLINFHISRKDRLLDLFRLSHARVGLGHTGGRIPLKAWLDFQNGFAQAKDAVFSQFDANQIKTLCTELKLECVELTSQANDPSQFLLRPDLGKLLSQASHDFLQRCKLETQFDLLLVISGGLSPSAITKHIPNFLPEFLHATAAEMSIAPIVITPRSRVAFGDQLNQYFKAKITIMFIGERPGLTTPDSLGIYVTYNAKPGCTDDQRNCISNIHSHGLSYFDAAAKLTSLLKIAMQNRMTGVRLEKITT